jgi:hypothetical protein
VESSDGARSVTLNGRITFNTGGGRQHIKVSGFIIDGTNLSTGNSPIYVGDNNFLVFDNFTARNGALAAAKTTGTSNGVAGAGNGHTWSNCEVHNNGQDIINPSSGYGFYINGTNHIVENCEIHHNGGYGVHAFKTVGGAGGIVVRNNTFHHNNTHATTAQAAFVLASGSGHQAYNNIIYDEGRGGMETFPSCTDCLIYNNIVYNSGRIGSVAGIYVQGPRSIVRNNIFYNNGGSNIAAEPTAAGSVYSHNLCFGTGGTGNCSTSGGNPNSNVNADPRFANIAGADFRPCTIAGSPHSSCPGASPTLLAGVNLSTIGITGLLTDKIGVARPSPPTLWTQGALQSSGAASPTIQITGPTTLITYSTNSSSVTITGTATAGSGSLIVPTWTNSRGGGSLCSGTTSWSCTITGLSPGGVNVITITATNTDGGKAVDSLDVAYVVPALIASYGFAEGTGTTVADLSGNGNTGTLVGAAAWGSGKYAGGIALTGGHIAIPDAANLDVIGGLTISMTVRLTAVFTDFRAVATKNNAWVLFATSEAAYCSGTAGLPYGYVNVAGSGNNGACQLSVLPINTNIDLAFTFDGTDQRTYKDGVLINTVSAPGHMTAGTGIMQLGCSQFGECPQAVLSEVRVYNYARSLSEIAADRAASLIVVAKPPAPVLKLNGLSKFNGVFKFGALP